MCSLEPRPSSPRFYHVALEKNRGVRFFFSPRLRDKILGEEGLDSRLGCVGFPPSPVVWDKVDWVGLQWPCAVKLQSIVCVARGKSHLAWNLG